MSIGKVRSVTTHYAVPGGRPGRTMVVEAEAVGGIEITAIGVMYEHNGPRVVPWAGVKWVDLEPSGERASGGKKKTAKPAPAAG